MIAQRTERIRIGVAVFVLPFHHPLRLAGAISQIDQLSGGRFDVAAGRGASPYQMRQFQAEREEADSRAFFAEHLGIMVDHWSTRDALSHDGRFFTYPNATVLPPPLQLPHPPLWIAALSTRSMEWAVKLGFDSNFIFSPFREPFTHVQEVYGAFVGAMEGQGRPRTSARFAVNRMTCVGNSDETHEILRYVLMNHRIIDQQLAGAERVNRGDYVVEKAIKQDEPDLEQMHANIAFGDIDQVSEKLAGYAQLGIDVFSAWHNVGQPHEQVVRSMEVFAKEIMPGLR
jgi:alkanesulfonate monooxygenase SsuD/methylene tetrahydromethanopterin reductase-like flavin-dependent oxidoreductase (luciferase family)